VSDERPYLELPLPSEEDRRLFEEWLRNKDDNEKDAPQEDERVIILDL